MEDPKTLSSVADFHSTFKHPILSLPTIPEQSRCKLRVSLIAEELMELEEGIEKKDIVEIADALCDLQYVLSGAILEFGLGERFKSLFDEVQRSNMSKACKNIQEAEATLDHYIKQSRRENFIWSTEKKTIKHLNLSIILPPISNPF
jgi:predicted HAD superfamily Cof-like phosphohydrolase